MTSDLYYKMLSATQLHSMVSQQGARLYSDYHSDYELLQRGKDCGCPKVAELAGPLPRNTF